MKYLKNWKQYLSLLRTSLSSTLIISGVYLMDLRRMLVSGRNSVWLSLVVRRTRSMVEETYFVLYFYFFKFH